MQNTLVMIGPGGDYVTRIDAEGDELVIRKGPAVAAPEQTAGCNQCPMARNQVSVSAVSFTESSEPQVHRTLAAVRPKASEPAYAVTFGSTYGTYGVEGSQMMSEEASNSQWAPDDRGAVLIAMGTWLAAQQRVMNQMARTVAQMIPTDDSINPSSMAMQAAARAAFAFNHCAAFSGGPTAFGEVTPHDESDTQATSHPDTDSRSSNRSRLFTDYARAGRRVEGQQGDRLRTRRGFDQKEGVAPGAKQGTLFGTQS